MGIPSPLCNSTQMASANKQTELDEFLERHNVKVAMNQTIKCNQSSAQILEPPETLAEPNLKTLPIMAKLGDTELIITTVYIPPTSSCAGGYLPSLDHLMITTYTPILAYFDAHHSAWNSSSTRYERPTYWRK